MTPLLFWILTWLGNLSVLVAICCLVWHIVMEFDAIIEKRWNDIVAMDNAAWLGLAYAGVWMACQIGRIGF